MTEFGSIFENPLSVMVLSYVTIGFIVAYATAMVWVTSQDKDSVFNALKTA